MNIYSSLIFFIGDKNVGLHMLATATNIVKNLAPLSLACETQLSSTGLEGLVDATEYLKEISVSTSEVCTECKSTRKVAVPFEWIV